MRAGGHSTKKHYSELCFSSEPVLFVAVRAEHEPEVHRAQLGLAGALIPEVPVESDVRFYFRIQRDSAAFPNFSCELMDPRQKSFADALAVLGGMNADGGQIMMRPIRGVLVLQLLVLKADVSTNVRIRRFGASVAMATAYRQQPRQWPAGGSESPVDRNFRLHFLLSGNRWNR